MYILIKKHLQFIAIFGQIYFIDGTTKYS